MQRTTLIWDGLVRLFHLTLAAGFIVAFVIANFAGEDSQSFPIHMMIGLTLAFACAIRLLWLFAGNRWASWRGLDMHPMSLAAYFKHAFEPKSPASTGHNPATSWATILMLCLIFALASTGLGMARGDEAFEGLHKAGAITLAVIAAVHMIGVIVHMAIKRDGLALSMVDGRKAADPQDGLPNGAPIPSLLYAVAIIFFLGSLLGNWNPSTGSTRWPISGSSLALGESEGHENSGVKQHEQNHEHGESEEHEEDDD